MWRIRCHKCGDLLTSPGTCKCGTIEIRDDSISVDNSVDSVDSVEISAAAQFLNSLAQQGLVLVNKEQHDKAVAARYYLARLAPLLNEIIDKKFLSVADAGKLIKMKSGGWF